MKFLVDESTGASVARYLAQTGHDVAEVIQIMPKADDIDILAYARRTERILVTNDKDFGELVYRRAEEHSGILLLRLEDESAANRVQIVKVVIEQYGDQIAGSFVVATEHNIRIRHSSK